LAVVIDWSVPMPAGDDHRLPRQRKRWSAVADTNSVERLECVTGQENLIGWTFAAGASAKKG
jgi:hypothetical protein